jgi:CubicO group peptidase (beta-lactamase class C family)
VYNDVLYRHVNTDYVALNPVSINKFSYDDKSGRTLEFVNDKSGTVTEVIVARPDGQFKLRKDPSAVPRTRMALAKTIPERVSQLVEKYVEYGQFNGSILVSQNGKIIYKKAFGMANIELKAPNETDTKYRLASVSKQFTAMLIMQLVQQGKVALTVPITTYLPDYPKEQGQKITLHHLLNHSSGIPNFTSFREYRDKIMRNPHTPQELVHLFDTLKLEFQPGERFNYSNSGYVLLGHIIEKVSGKTYEQCLKDQIFGPLKMNNSGFDHNDAILTKRAQGYEKVGNEFLNTSFIDMSVPFAAGSLYSTIEDLYLWDQALYTDVLLSAKLREQLFTNYFEGKQGNYGYGWGIYALPSVRSAQTLTFTEHSGGINGFNTFISRVLNDKHCVILLSNTSGAPLAEISHAIAAILYERPFDMPKKSLAYALADVIRAQGLQTGLSKFKDMKNSGLYKMDEGEINAVGYDFMRDKQFKEAIGIFKLNVEAYPNSGNCYDSLGEAYMNNGDKQLAIENYKRSIELDPQNENGKKILAELMKQ